MATWTESFEDSTIENFQYNQDLERTSYYNPPLGSWCARYYGFGVGNEWENKLGWFNPPLLDGGEQIQEFRVRLQEGPSSAGSGLRLTNSNGNVECGFSIHEGYVFAHDNGLNQTQIGSMPMEEWFKLTVSFNWENSTATITCEGQSSTVSHTVSIAGSGIESIELWMWNNYYDSWTGGNPSSYNLDIYYDGFYVKSGSAPASPNSPDVTINSNDNVEFSWVPDTSGGDVQSYEIEANINGGGYATANGGPSTVQSGTTSVTYTPVSDSSYGSFVGIDSSISFRVRALNSVGTSNWATSGTAYTDPIPPHNPSVSRPDANTITAEWAVQSDLSESAEIQIREDTGSGYSSWQTATSPSLQLDGNGDVSLPTLGFSGDSSITISAEVTIDSGAGSSNNIFGFGNTSTDNSCSIRTNGDGGVKFYFWGNDLNASTSNYYGSKVRVTAVYDSANSTRRIYLNGSQVASDSPSAPSFDDMNYSIGGYNGEHLDGIIHNLTVHNRPLSSSEISDLNNDVRITSGLVAEYFEESASDLTSAHDSSGSGNHGTVNSGTWMHGTGGSESISTSDVLQQDSRYQLRLRSHGWGLTASDWVYADYGNEGNVFFEDDFESGDLSAWSEGRIYGGASDSQSGIQSGGHGDLGISGADQGTYYCRLDSGDDIREKIGTISTDSDVLVKAVVATGSMDNSSEQTYIEWYDGSSYQSLRTFGWEYNKQGWVEVSAIVPSSYLNSNNHIRLRGYGGGGDHFAVDRVIVSDLLHEYTSIPAVSSISTTTDTQGEIGTDWTVNNTFGRTRAKLREDGQFVDQIYGPPPVTFNGLPDGHEYELQYVAQLQQDRRGSEDYTQKKWADSRYVITLLPDPTPFSHTEHDDGTVTFTWTDDSTDELGFRVLESNDAGATFSTLAELDPNTEQYTTTAIDNVNDRQYKIVIFTDDATSETGTVTIEASTQGYATDGNFSKWHRKMPTETPAIVEQGDGTGSSSLIPEVHINEDMDVIDRMDNSMYSTAGDGSQVQGIPLPGDDTRGRRVTYVQELDPAPDVAWPLRVDTQLTVQLEDLDKLAGFDASIGSECAASITVDSVEEIVGTNEVKINLSAIYNCPEIGDDETIDSRTTVQPNYDGNNNSGVNGGSVSNPDITDSDGNDAGSGWSGGVTWDGGGSGWEPTKPPKFDIGHDCSPIEDGIKVPLKIYYSGSDAEPIYSYTTKIDYDQDVLEFAGFEDPSEEHPDYEVMSQITAQFPDEDDGAIKFRAYGDFAFKPWQSDHLNIVTYLKFNIVGDNGDSSYLNFVETYQKDDPYTEYTDESFFANSPFLGERPSTVEGEGGTLVSWSEEYYSGFYYHDLRENWRPYRFSNGGASVGNGVNVQANDTEIGERTKVEISVDATTRISGYDITIGYPAEDSDTPFKLITADSGDLEDDITISDEYDRGLVHISASDEAADIEYEDPVLANLYFEPVSVYDDSSDLSIRYVTGDIWDIDAQMIRVDCTSEASLSVGNSQEIRPTEPRDVPEGQSISDRYTVDVPDETVDVDWPIIMNQTFTINGVVTDNLKNIDVEFRSATNPDIEWTKNDWWTVDDETAAVNATFTIHKAENQKYPPTFYPIFEFDWGGGTGQNMNGYINQSSNMKMGATATSGNGGGTSISIRPGLPPNWSRSQNGNDE